MSFVPLKITDYIVVVRNTSYGLEEAVKSYLKKGWVLLGGVSYGRRDNEAQDMYAQAMGMPESLQETETD